MRRSVIPRRLSQPTLFRPPASRPSFQTLPPEIQEKTIRLLARLLRGHVDGVVADALVREAMMSDKIKPHPLARKAMLYVRQSSAHQVLHNLESQRLQ